MVNRVWRASAQICDMVPSGTLWFLREHSGPFGDNMVPSGTLWRQYGVDLCSTQRGLRCIWDSRPPYCSWYVICSLSGLVCDSRSCQAIQYTQGSQSYDYLSSVVCTLHLHTLLTEFYTHKYSYIAEGTDDIWDRGGVPTFWPRLVYMSILTLWFPDKLFLSVYIMYIFLRGSLCEYVYMYTSDYV